jgi:beta-lactamase superfamily II metal-dependent hydrolase
VGHLVSTENIGETMVANTYQYALQNEGVPITYARTGQKFLLGSSTLLQVLAPMNNPQMLESNTASIVVQLVYGSTTFMLTGDAPIGIEDYLVKNFGSSLASDVLKLGHHGSKTSTSPLFLDTVSPSFVVVSAGRNNSYGHPHASVVELVNDRGIDLVSTALSGNITFLSDGTRVWIK